MPFDSTPQVTPALALLRAARAKIEDPRNWVKRWPNILENTQGIHCAVTSVTSLADASSDVVRRILFALAKSLPPGYANYTIWDFNDAPETMHADILALFLRSEPWLMEAQDERSVTDSH